MRLVREIWEVSRLLGRSFWHPSSWLRRQIPQVLKVSIFDAFQSYLTNLRLEGSYKTPPRLIPAASQTKELSVPIEQGCSMHRIIHRAG